jgi:hypothetical protein
MVKALRFAGSQFTLSPITTPTEKLPVKVPLASKNKFMLQHGEIDHRQHAGIHSDS